jgi:hypothetical protein
MVLIMTSINNIIYMGQTISELVLVEIMNTSIIHPEGSEGEMLRDPTLPMLLQFLPEISLLKNPLCP